MRKIHTASFVIACLLSFSPGCAVTSVGSGAWDIFAGVRSQQYSEEPASIKIESKVFEDFLKAIIDGKITPAEKELITKILWHAAQWYFKIPGVIDLF